MTDEKDFGFGGVPSLLTGTESTLVAEIPKAGTRWKQVHFNIDVMRRFFHLERGNARSITQERISPGGAVQSRNSRQLVFSDANKNSRLEFDFDPLPMYPASGEKPILVAVEAVYLTFRYKLVMPGDPGYIPLSNLLAAGQSIGKGTRRRIVTLDEVEAYWPQAGLRGSA
tara:strand:- start:2888 stop:3397 length:510 start_codon:yes stop_codon:yes gene_type:complete